MNTSFEKTSGKEEWLTPKFILDALGEFDLDPCASEVRPWPTAKEHFTIKDNGLLKPWKGFVWCNPPYGGETKKWFRKLSEHPEGGIALTFARTETEMFFDSVWNRATAVMFIKGRLSFCDTSGKPGGSAGAASVLISYGEKAKGRLLDCGLQGCFLDLGHAKTNAETKRGNEAKTFELFAA